MFVLHARGVLVRTVWFGVAGFTILVELIPVPVMPSLIHYGIYGPSKLICFLILGFLTPIAFRRMNRKIGFAFVSALGIEALQAFTGNGHSFHFYELAAKWLAILWGFTVGLDVMAEGEIKIGRFGITILRCEEIHTHSLG